MADQVAAVAHTQFLPTLAAVVSLEEAVAHLDIELLPSFGEEEEEEVHPFAVDHIDLQPHSKLVAAAAAEAGSYSAASHIEV